MILFIDDDKVRLQPVVEWLRLEKYEVETADSVAAALDVLRTRGNDVQLMVVDIMIPPGPVGDVRFAEKTEHRPSPDLPSLKEFIERKRVGIWFLRVLDRLLEARGIGLKPLPKVVFFSALERSNLLAEPSPFGLQGFENVPFVQKPDTEMKLADEIRNALGR